MKLLLVDLSSIAYPIFHVSGKEPDVDHVSHATVARVRGMVGGFDGVAICCDSPKSVRKTWSPEYKADRVKNEVVVHQIRLAQETLEADGFPVWSVEGYEADDVICSAVQALGGDGVEIVIASADKDLLQLASESVTVVSTASGARYNVEEVRAKFGVTPQQMRDYLTLVGDASDNVRGAPGIGPKRAAEILQRHGSLAELMPKLMLQGCEALGLTPSVHKSLLESVPQLDLARKLITLVCHLQLDFEAIKRPREAKPLTDEPTYSNDEEETDVQTINNETGEVIEQPKAAEPEKPEKPRELRSAAAAKVDASAPTAFGMIAPPSWDLALEPTNPSSAYKIAASIFNSRMFPNLPNADAVFAVILMGRTLGVDSLTMMRNVHVIEGKITLAASFIVGLVLRSGLADYFKCVETTQERAVYKTHRKGDPDPEPTILTYTVEDAKRQQLLMPIEPGKKPSNWHKIPGTMCRHRCSTELARAVYPDVVSGLYAPEDFTGGDRHVVEAA